MAATFWLAIAATAAAGGDSGKPRFEPVTVRGVVMGLPAALKTLGVASDDGPIARQIVVKADDGRLEPLLPTEACRALFLDRAFLGKKTEVYARRHAGFPYLEVISFKVEHAGRFRTPEYYCEICSISVGYPQVCPCCQGAVELRMKPEAK